MLYQAIVEPFTNISPLYTVALSLFLALLPLMDAHYNHSNQKPNMLTLAWVTVGMCGLGLLILLAFSRSLQMQITFGELLGLQIVSMAVILVFHLVLLLWAVVCEACARKKRRK